ncbi:MAG: PAS domain-containing protein [Salinarimonadaceae bacterium]|nr:MAG: PAS domain-containing protein [Salinarimonadaceae bacterium]
MLTIEAISNYAEALHSGVVVTEPVLDDGGPRIIYANPAMEKLTGYSRDALIGSTPRVLQGKATSRFTLKALGQALRAGRPFHTCVTNYRADGEAYLCEIDIRPVFGPDGRIERFIAFEREVVRRRVRVRPGRNARYKPIDQRVAAEAEGPLARFACFASPLD